MQILIILFGKKLQNTSNHIDSVHNTFFLKFAPMAEEQTIQDGSSSGQPQKIDNTLILERVHIHPLTSFDEANFIDLLEHSLSLSTFEKKRVIDAVPNLSQFQIDELIKVFEDERIEFRKLMPTEGETIKGLVMKARNEWEQLKVIYIEEAKQQSTQSEEQKKIDEMRKNL